jgi:hypothetical protein
LSREHPRREQGRRDERSTIGGRRGSAGDVDDQPMEAERCRAGEEGRRYQGDGTIEP